MQVTLKIKRFNPEKDTKPWWGEYQVEAEPTDRLLDALNHVKWYIDGSLTYRRSCAHGICGSDAMLINGRTVTPGDFMSSIIRVIPLCFGASASLRARSKLQSL